MCGLVLFNHNFIDFFKRKKRQHSQKVFHFIIRCANKKLIQRKWRRFHSIKPNCIAFGFSKFFPITRGKYRYCNAKGIFVFLQSLDQTVTCTNVAQLIGTTKLKLAFVMFEELPPVVRLTHLIRKLSKTDSFIGFHSGSNRSKRQHVTNAKVSTDVTDEIQKWKFSVPFCIVDNSVLNITNLIHILFQTLCIVTKIHYLTGFNFPCTLSFHKYLRWLSKIWCNCFFMHDKLCFSSFASMAFRSVDLPLGSPMRPVAPPTNAIGLWPARWKWSKPMITSKFPMWRLSAVGSKPA